MPTGKASCWSITINNPTDDDHAQWENLKTLPWVKLVSGQLEQGENDTPHIQGMIQTEYGRFFEKLKQALPRAHIEIAKNKFALTNYVAKQDTRIGTVPQYERPATRIATQKDIQRMLLFLVKCIAPSKYPERWNASESYEDFLIAHGWMVKRDADFWIDTVVSRLIQDGYYGVEFVMANNQVRGAFKRYLNDILLREYHAENSQD